MSSVDSNFNFLCGRPHGAGPHPPSTCVHLSLHPPSPSPCHNLSHISEPPPKVRHTSRNPLKILMPGFNNYIGLLLNFVSSILSNYSCIVFYCKKLLQN